MLGALHTMIDFTRIPLESLAMEKLSALIVVIFICCHQVIIVVVGNVMT